MTKFQKSERTDYPSPYFACYALATHSPMARGYSPTVSHLLFLIFLSQILVTHSSAKYRRDYYLFQKILRVPLEFV